MAGCCQVLLVALDLKRHFGHLVPNSDLLVVHCLGIILLVSDIFSFCFRNYCLRTHDIESSILAIEIIVHTHT